MTNGIDIEGVLCGLNQRLDDNQQAQLDQILYQYKQLQPFFLQEYLVQYSLEWLHDLYVTQFYICLMSYQGIITYPILV